MNAFRALKYLFSSITWHIDTAEKELYLTFDDGPLPNLTSWILDELDKYNAKATFFVVGENAKRHEPIFNEIVNRGHAIGNHTFNHLNGWTTSLKNYLDNVEKCKTIINELHPPSTILHQPLKLFRPPYGKLKPSQIKHLKKQYRIVMWDILSYDYNQNVSAEQCFKNVLRKTKEGSIIVFHDNYKAEKSLRYALPKVLEHYTSLGFSFRRIEVI